MRWRVRFTWRRKRGRALTLIEVLAAVTILGGAVTAMLVTQANSIEHLHSSGLQLTARHVAKEIRNTWIIEKTDQSLPASGVVEGMEGWSWKRTVRPVQVVEDLSVTEVTLQLRFTSGLDLRVEPWVREYRWLIDDRKH